MYEKYLGHAVNYYNWPDLSEFQFELTIDSVYLIDCWKTENALKFISNC